MFTILTQQILLPQKSHECGFIFILCHKNYRKTTFNSGILHAKFAMTLCRWSHGITSTCPTIGMTSLRIPPDDTDATEEIRIIHVVSHIFIPPPDTTARSPASTGQILFIFYEIYRVDDSARCRINFAQKGIFLLRFRKFRICTLELTALGHGIK
jgi:hypothetical protein